MNMLSLDKTKLEELLALCRDRLPNVDEELIEKAYDFSLIAHQNDRRASGEPYFTHPYAVAKLLCREIPFDDVSVACGLLHDVVEDNEDYTVDSIRGHFGEEIAVIVDGLTKIKALFRGTDINEAENYRKFLMSVTKDIRVIIVKFADRLHNMRELEFLKSDKKKRIAKETLEIYAPLAHRFGLGKIKWELEDLAFKELNKLAFDEIKKKINQRRGDREGYINNFTSPIIRKLDEYGFKYDVSGRPKHLYSIYRKMIKQNKPFEEIYDLFAVRIILETDDTNECYTTLGIVNTLYIPVPDRFKDYIAIPKANNYQSLHTTVLGPQGRLVEVQIRTRKMHIISEQGVAAHWKYKEGKSEVDNRINDYVNWIRDLLENSGSEDVRKNIIDNFKLNLYSDEIYVFTPKGDLKRLPVGSTPVDFAFAIHSKIGYHCIGAKVDKKIVPLDTKLNRGDQVDIITSKNQHPNKNWLKFVVTQKAKTEIKKHLNKEEEKSADTGREVWQKKLKKMKLSFTDQDTLKLANSLKYDNLKQFFTAIAQSRVNMDEVLQPRRPEPEKKQLDLENEFTSFTQYARDSGGDMIVDGTQSNMEFTYAKCCNPIPGDPVAGYVTMGEGIKIHRKNCKNLIEISRKEPEKIVSVSWPQVENGAFIVGLTIHGSDQTGMLNELATTIVAYQNTSIKSINIDTHDSLFEGTITLFVQDLQHLSRIIERLKKIKGVTSVKRLTGTLS